MTTPKHTPGPWIYRKELGSPWPTLHGKTSSAWIAQIPDSTSADANLIASAPALLAAAQSVVHPSSEGCEESMEALRQAVRDATGENA